jgi:undecaprenyl-diphosphatase
MTHLFLWLGMASLAFGLFIKITDEVFEDAKVDAIDKALLIVVAKCRASWLNGAMVDLSALGSPTLVVLLSALALVLFLLTGDRFGALQVLVTSVGAGFWTVLTKSLIERARPEVVPRLVEVSGSSYPSGHALLAASMYLMLAILACRHFSSVGARVTLLAIATTVIGLVSISRLYLGVHYPSDIASGISLGAAWTLLLAGGFSFITAHPLSSLEKKERRSSHRL